MFDRVCGYLILHIHFLLHEYFFDEKVWILLTAQFALWFGDRILECARGTRPEGRQFVLESAEWIEQFLLLLVEFLLQGAHLLLLQLESPQFDRLLLILDASLLLLLESAGEHLEYL